LTKVTAPILDHDTYSIWRRSKWPNIYTSNTDYIYKEIEAGLWNLFLNKYCHNAEEKLYSCVKNERKFHTYIHSSESRKTII